MNHNANTTTAVHYEGVTYCVLNVQAELIKIGKTLNLYSRMCCLRNQSGADLLLIAVLNSTKHEAVLHQKLKEHRVVGEWFEPCREVLQTIREHYEIEGINVLDLIFSDIHRGLVSRYSATTVLFDPVFQELVDFQEVTEIFSQALEFRRTGSPTS